MNPMLALAERIETNLKVASGPDMDVRFTMNRDAAAAYAEQLRVTARLVDEHGWTVAEIERLRAELTAARDALYNGFEPDNQSRAWHRANAALEQKAPE
jgi:hypothetical protein